MEDMIFIISGVSVLAALSLIFINGSLKRQLNISDRIIKEKDKRIKLLKQAIVDKTSTESESLVCYRCKEHGWIGKLADKKDCEICN